MKEDEMSREQARRYPQPPASGDIQRRCWTLYMHPDGNGQCVLFNGHDGAHQFAPAVTLSRRGRFHDGGQVAEVVA